MNVVERRRRASSDPTGRETWWCCPPPGCAALHPGLFSCLPSRKTGYCRLANRRRCFNGGMLPPGCAALHPGLFSGLPSGKTGYYRLANRRCCFRTGSTCLMEGCGPRFALRSPWATFVFSILETAVAGPSRRRMGLAHRYVDLVLQNFHLYTHKVTAEALLSLRYP